MFSSLVWAVHPVREDLTAALHFGVLRYANERYIFGDEVGRGDEMPFWFQNNIRIAVEEFAPSRDYMLLVGDHVQIASFAAMLARYHGDFRVLRYDREAKGYFPVLIKSNPGAVRPVGDAA